MKSASDASMKMREMVFQENDYFNEEKMVHKLDFLIQALAAELHHKKYIDQIPNTEEGWSKLFETQFGLNEIRKEDWEAYVAGGLKFFLELKRSIKQSEFLKQNDIYRSYRFLHWKSGLRPYWNPLLERLLLEFYKTYCMILEIKQIRVKYMEC